MGKKSYATIPLSISFPWAWEGKPPVFFFKNFKIPKVHPSDSIPLNPKRHTCLDAPSVPVAHYKIVYYLLHSIHVFSKSFMNFELFQ